MKVFAEFNDLSRPGLISREESESGERCLVITERRAEPRLDVTRVCSMQRERQIKVAIGFLSIQIMRSYHQPLLAPHSYLSPLSRSSFCFVAGL